MKKKIILLTQWLFISGWGYAQNGFTGINTKTPQANLHINGSLQVTNQVISSGTAGTVGQVLKSNGPGQPPTWKRALEPHGTDGTLIAVDRDFMVATEFIVLMSADYTWQLSTGTIIPIGNLTTEITDNENRFFGTATTNSSTVAEEGEYLITMNMQLETAFNDNPTIGLYDEFQGAWLCRVNDNYNVTNTGNTGTRGQTYTLMSSVELFPGRLYSFRLGGQSNVTIKKGGTGTQAMSQISLKRLK